jgi:hypothetical protein
MMWIPLREGFRGCSKHNCRVEIWRGGTLRLRFQIPLIKPDVRISRIAAFGQGYLCFRPRPSCAEAFQVE